MRLKKFLLRYYPPGMNDWRPVCCLVLLNNLITRVKHYSLLIPNISEQVNLT